MMFFYAWSLTQNIGDFSHKSRRWWSPIFYYMNCVSHKFWVRVVQISWSWKRRSNTIGISMVFGCLDIIPHEWHHVLVEMQVYLIDEWAKLLEEYSSNHKMRPIIMLVVDETMTILKFFIDTFTLTISVSMMAQRDFAINLE